MSSQITNTNTKINKKNGLKRLVSATRILSIPKRQKREETTHEDVLMANAQIFDLKKTLQNVFNASGKMKFDHNIFRLIEKYCTSQKRFVGGSTVENRFLENKSISSESFFLCAGFYCFKIEYQNMKKNKNVKFGLEINPQNSNMVWDSDGIDFVPDGDGENYLSIQFEKNGKLKLNQRFYCENSLLPLSETSIHYLTFSFDGNGIDILRVGDEEILLDLTLWAQTNICKKQGISMARFWFQGAENTAVSIMETSYLTVN